MLVYVGMHTPDSGQPLKNTGKYWYTRTPYSGVTIKPAEGLNLQRVIKKVR